MSKCIPTAEGIYVTAYKCELTFDKRVNLCKTSGYLKAWACFEFFRISFDVTLAVLFDGLFSCDFYQNKLFQHSGSLFLMNYVSLLFDMFIVTSFFFFFSSSHELNQLLVPLFYFKYIYMSMREMHFYLSLHILVIMGVERLSCEKRLRELSLFSLEERWGEALSEGRV